jgi:hypothetical protein
MATVFDPAHAAEFQDFVFGVVNREWAAIREALAPMLGVCLAPEDYEAKVHFMLAALALAIGQDVPTEFRAGVFRSLLADFMPDAPDLVRSFARYERVCKAWPNLNEPDLGCRFLLPPLEYPHELVAILLMDQWNVESVFEMQGKRTYNLFHATLLGMALLTAATEARKLFIRQHSSGKA